MKLRSGLSLVWTLCLMAHQGTSKPSKQFQPGFMDNINFDGFIGSSHTAGIMAKWPHTRQICVYNKVHKNENVTITIPVSISNYTRTGACIK